MWYTSSSGRIELNIPLRVAEMGYHSGQCDADVAWIMKNEKRVAAQLRRVNPEVLKDELRKYGCWDDEELEDHQVNLARLLWLACGDIMEEEWHRKHG